MNRSLGYFAGGRALISGYGGGGRWVVGLPRPFEGSACVSWHEVDDSLGEGGTRVEKGDFTTNLTSSPSRKAEKDSQTTTPSALSEYGIHCEDQIEHPLTLVSEDLNEKFGADRVAERAHLHKILKFPRTPSKTTAKILSSTHAFYEYGTHGGEQNESCLLLGHTSPNPTNEIGLTGYAGPLSQRLLPQNNTENPRSGRGLLAPSRNPAEGNPAPRPLTSESATRPLTSEPGKTSQKEPHGGQSDSTNGIQQGMHPYPSKTQ
ncbi:hypothetical protein CYMTET_44082 [Cymbomonas tetramitiformis]|uniref:Uncharacterized protein n=1 Tax=Cymbomonas tetramitiformis TaxID=36881 RepID=A0AAE0F006_9CHLO|nr:hypothetical protein CYMTET_44082 [Cymbomonas tetramitiformis]